MATPAPPLVRVTDETDEFAFSGTYLEGGPLVPRVYLPLVREWTQEEVTIAAGDRTRTLALGQSGDLSHLHEPGTWDRLSAEFGIAQAINLQGRIEGAGQAHRCAQCASLSPWSVEWVTGALLLTGTVECRVCWYRDRRPWAVAVAKDLAVVYPGGDVEGDLHAP